MAFSNERLVAALVEGGTVEKAAKIAGCSERLIYNRLRDDNEFQGLYGAAKADLVRGIVTDLQARAGRAIATLDTIAADEENPPSTRIAAAKAILDNLATFSSRLTDVDRTANRSGRTALEATLLSLCE